MKTKQEQIAEMQKIICINCKDKYSKKGYVCPWQDKDAKCYNCEKLSEALYNAGYRKTPNDIRELIDVLYEGANLKEKLDEIQQLKEENEMLANKYKNLEIKYSNLYDKYRLCKDANETLKQNVITARKETAEAIYNASHCKVDEIKRLEKENACLLKACEEQFTFDTTENKKYSIFNSVRKEFAEKLKEKALLHCRTINCYECKFIETTIDELLEELKK